MISPLWFPPNSLRHGAQRAQDQEPVACCLDTPAEEPGSKRAAAAAMGKTQLADCLHASTACWLTRWHRTYEEGRNHPDTGALRRERGRLAVGRGWLTHCFGWWRKLLGREGEKPERLPRLPREGEDRGDPERGGRLVGEERSEAGWLSSAGREAVAFGRLCGDMQIHSSGPQSKASSFLLSQRCVLASKMEIHRYVPAVTESIESLVLLCVLTNLCLYCCLLLINDRSRPHISWMSASSLKMHGHVMLIFRFIPLFGGVY